ncbi:TIGR02757 family protein [Gracilimonas sp.]|uniref:TIGR02757 family protein n=1 Tax=Gracilimonas sp. TaxID=1974203 RepID=UPI002870C54E|nr:TIGR02757 family protein [Gracilimonas sp.]
MPQKRKRYRTISKKKLLELKPFLDDLIEKIEQPGYINDDPVQFMHAFEDKNDRELAGFFAATMAWGRRDIVNAKVEDLLNRMDNRPAEFILNYSESDAQNFEGFKHRTFKPIDMHWITKTLQSIMLKFGDFEQFWAFCHSRAKTEKRELIAVFHEHFFTFHPEIPQRVRKHVSNPEKNSSAKRLYMYLRWVIRNDSPVDPGTMDFISPAKLKIPLDVHVARQARKLGLLSRKQNDWKAVLELTKRMKILDPEDPAKYDYALFGIGVLGSEIPEEFDVNKRVE